MQINHHIEKELSFFAHASNRLSPCATEIPQGISVQGMRSYCPLMPLFYVDQDLKTVRKSVNISNFGDFFKIR